MTNPSSTNQIIGIDWALSSFSAMGVTVSRDEQTGALYCKVRDGRVARTECLDDDPQVLADYDESGRVLGVEILLGDAPLSRRD